MTARSVFSSTSSPCRAYIASTRTTNAANVWNSCIAAQMLYALEPNAPIIVFEQSCLFRIAILVDFNPSYAQISVSGTSIPWRSECALPSDLLDHAPETDVKNPQKCIPGTDRRGRSQLILRTCATTLHFLRNSVWIDCESFTYTHMHGAIFELKLVDGSDLMKTHKNICLRFEGFPLVSRVGYRLLRCTHVLPIPYSHTDDSSDFSHRRNLTARLAWEFLVRCAIATSRRSIFCGNSQCELAEPLSSTCNHSSHSLLNINQFLIAMVYL